MKSIKSGWNSRLNKPANRNKEGGKQMFATGWYNVKWFNSKEEVIANEEMFLTAPLYNQEIMKMQNAFLNGQDVQKLVATPIEKK